METKVTKNKNKKQTMSSSVTDQTALLQQVLGAVKQLQINQTQLASNVDAISGRVNVLAGLKEVRDVAAAVDSESQPVKKNQENIKPSESAALDDAVVPPSPSLPVAQLAGDVSSGSASDARRASTTGNSSRIILT